jgi:hypothetical protein
MLQVRGQAGDQGALNEPSMGLTEFVSQVSMRVARYIATFPTDRLGEEPVSNEC